RAGSKRRHESCISHGRGQSSQRERAGPDSSPTGGVPMTDRTTTQDPTPSRAPGQEDHLFSESERERARQAAEEIKSAAKDAAASTATALRNRLSGELDYRKY